MRPHCPMEGFISRPACWLPVDIDDVYDKMVLFGDNEWVPPASANATSSPKLKATSDASYHHPTVWDTPADLAAFVVAVEVASLLLPVEGIVRGVEVEGDLIGGVRMGLQTQFDRERLQDLGGVIDLVLAAEALGGGAFEPVEGALACQGKRVATVAFL